MYLFRIFLCVMVEVLNLNQAENKKTLQTSFESTVLWAVSDWKLTPEESFLLVERFKEEKARLWEKYTELKNVLKKETMMSLYKLSNEAWYQELVWLVEELYTWKWEKEYKSVDFSRLSKLKESWTPEDLLWFLLETFPEETTWLLNIDKRISKIIEWKPELAWKFQWDITQYRKMVLEILFNSIRWNLWWNIWWLNITSYDKDGNSVINAKEWKEFFWDLDKALSSIIQLWSIDWYDLQVWQYKDKGMKWGTIDKYVASKLDFSDTMNWAVTSFLENEFNVTPDEIETKKEEHFSITNWESYRDLGVVLLTEIPEWIEEIFKFLADIPAWLVLLWRYLNNRVLLNTGTIQEQIWAEIEINEMLKENTALWLVDLLWEKWIEMIKKLWEMLTSWKIWDIANIIFTIAWVIAWWALAVRTWINIARKVAVWKARRMWLEWRIMDWWWSDYRRILRESEWKAARVEDMANAVDSALTTWWVGVLVWHTNIFINDWLNYSKTLNPISNDNIKPSSNLPANENLQELQSKWKDWIYLSKFSDRVPESLKHEWDVLAWVNLDWSVSYNKSLLEEKIWVKISQEWNNVLFDWLDYIAFIRSNTEKWEKLMSYLKMLKWHEMTHNLLQTKKITRIAVPMPDWTTKIFTQEYICRVVDWSMDISVEEKLALEEALKLEFWPDFKLDSDYIRNRATREIADWRDVSREVEAARSTQNTLNISENDNSLIDLTILSWKNIDWVAMQIEEFWKKVKLDVFLYLNNWNNKAVAQLRLEEIQAISRYIDSRIPKWLTKNERTQFILYFQSMEEKLKRYIDFSTDARLINLFDNFLSKIEEKHKLIQNIF